MSRTAASIILAVILLAYLSIGAAYAINTPAWQAPDEPAHYNYVKFIAEKGALPVLQPGDYDQTYNEQFTRTPQSVQTTSIDPLRYEFYAPPLYYLLAAPIYSLTGGWIIALRLFSVVLGGLLVVVAYLIAAELFPSMWPIPWGTAAFVAFLPQHVAMLSAVNNDSLAELLIALIVWQAIRLFRSGQPSQRALLILGLTLGLGLLTKATVYYTAVPVAAIALILHAKKNSESRIQSVAASRHAPVVRQFSLIFIPALSLGALWWIRNLRVYGGLDVLGLARHSAVVAGQPTTADWIATHGWSGLLNEGLTTTFHSFWGQFGWMAVPMPDSTYLLLGLLSLAAFVGWVWRLIEMRAAEHRGRIRPQSGLLALLALSTFVGFVWYNLTFVQHQGRYLFPALIPIGLAFSLGLDQLLRKLKEILIRLTSRGQRDLTPWLDEAHLLAFGLLFIFLARLDVIALQRYILPTLTP